MKSVTCQGCVKFDRTTPTSAIGNCTLHKIEVLETRPRYCADWRDAREFLEKFATTPKRRTA